MKKFYLILAVISLFVHAVQAQVLLDNDFENFDYNVKQIDEFILRFNLKELLIQPNQNDQYERVNRILLFDKSYYRDNTVFLNDFLGSVEKQNTVLSFYDSTWFAIADCNVTFKGKKDKITLILRTERVKDDIYKWSITDANGDILELIPKTQSDRLRLLPTDNEVNFMSLQSVTTSNAQNITLFNEGGHINDRLSVFDCLVYNKLLKIDNVQELTYCFTQVKGYKFYVKNYLRDGKNAGWLISDVQKENAGEQIESEKGSSIENAKQQVRKLYEMLSSYADNPANVALAKDIQSLFYKTPIRYFFFGTKHIFDDIDVFFHNYSPNYAYVSISDYLNSLDNIVRSGISLSYCIRELTAIQLDEELINLTYKVELTDKENNLFEYNAKATIRDGLILDIVMQND